VFDVNSKHVSYTHAPEYIPLANVVTASLVSAAIPEVKIEIPKGLKAEDVKATEPPPPFEPAKKPKKVTIAPTATTTTTEKKKRVRKLAIPTVEVSVPTAIEEAAPVAKVSRLEDDSSESKNKTATL
jgi:hypothetical protein